MTFGFSIHETTLAFCGRQFVYLYSTKYDRSKTTLRSEYSGSDDLISLDLHKYLPPVKTNLERASAICCNLSEDGQFLCAADSEKNVFIFQKIHRSWDHYSSFAMEKRILKIQFDNDATNLIIVDKCGDVIVSSMSSPDTVSNPSKLYGLTALTLDTILSLNNHQMLTCDGQIKMFVTRFPDAREIKAYSFGRAETIANIILFNRDQLLLSVSGDGFLKMWNMADHRCLKTFNLFHIIHGPKHQRLQDTEIKRMRLTEAFGHNYFALKIFGYTEIPVFELTIKEPTVRQLGQVKMDSEFCDFGWYENALYTYNPEISVVLKRFTVSHQGVLCDTNFQIPRVSDLRIDFRAFVSFMQSTLTLRKHFSSDLIRLSQGSKLMNDFIAAAEKKIPRLVRGSRSRALEMLDHDQNQSKSPILPIPVSLKFFRSSYESKHADTNSPLPGPSHPLPVVVSSQQSKAALENPYLVALNHYPRLVEIAPTDESDEPRPLTRGTSRILQNLLKKSQLDMTENYDNSEPDEITYEIDKNKEEILSRPSTARSRPRSKVSVKSDIFYTDLPEEIIPDHPDAEVTRISIKTAIPFLDTLRIAHPHLSHPPHWPSELTRIISSRPHTNSDFDADDEEETSEIESLTYFVKPPPTN